MISIRAYNNKLFLTLLVLFGTLAAGSASAQSSTPSLPVALEKAAPEAAPPRFGPPPEGWIKIRYSILKDGSTAEIEVLDVMPPEMSTLEPLETIKGWTFTPAMLNDKAIGWHNNIEYVVFDNELTPNTLGALIGGDYERVKEYIAAEKYKRAKNRSEKLIRQSLSTLYDIGLANMQLASVELKLEDYHAAFDAIRIATPQEVTMLTPEEMGVALQYRFSIAIVLGQLADALETYERRVAISPLPEEHNMVVQGETIRNVLAGDRALAIKGMIAENSWNHEPSRHAFTITDVDGRVDSIDVICNRGKTSIEYQADSEWALPASWGDCSLEILGKDDTTFTYYEMKEDN